ncbi:MAG: acyl-CoA dehydrogenase family protein [Deltaproteobacteria bacterium]|nr:acyl-CoA dehydrogenase family protein [Deltaproteobacteria bacterium]
MEFELSETQQLIRQTARDFAIKELLPGAAEREREGVFPKELLAKMAGLGLMGINVPESRGGVEAGVVAYALAMMEIARCCGSTAVTMSVTNMVAEILCKFGREDQIDQHVPRICSGEYTAGAFALSEPGCGSDAAALKTSARRKNGGWVLNGTKQFITSGAYSGVTVVWARTGGSGSRGISAFLATPDTAGLSVGAEERKMGLRASNTVSLVFEDAELPEDALLGEEGRGFPIAMEALDGGRIGVSSQAIGIAQAALEAAVEYAKERKTFGKRLADHQAIQWMLADSATELEAARLLTLQAAHLKETGRPFTRQASMAKVFSTEAANRICARAFQIHGGYGYVEDYPVERYLRDSRVTTIYEGTSEIQRLVIARQLLQD